MGVIDLYLEAFLRKAGVLKFGVEVDAVVGVELGTGDGAVDDQGTDSGWWRSMDRGNDSVDAAHRITIDDSQCGGRPCIRGMRIRVSDILSLLSTGASYEEILSDYPYLEREDILASVKYAAQQVDHPVLLSA